MDLELGPEQRELRTLAADLLAERVPIDLPRAYLEGHGDATALWDELVELGWYGVGLEPDDGFGLPGLCLLCEQAGRRLAPTLLVDAAVAARIAGPVDGLRVAGDHHLRGRIDICRAADLASGGLGTARFNRRQI